MGFGARRSVPQASPKSLALGLRRLWGVLGFQGLGFRALGLQGLGFRGLGFRVLGLQGQGFRGLGV